MTEKIYKNKNMIREVHRTRRYVRFSSLVELRRFVSLYEDILDRRYGINEENLTLVCSIEKGEFDQIARDLCLKKDVRFKDRLHPTYYWRTETALA